MFLGIDLWCDEAVGGVQGGVRHVQFRRKGEVRGEHLELVEEGTGGHNLVDAEDGADGEGVRADCAHVDDGVVLTLVTGDEVNDAAGGVLAPDASKVETRCPCPGLFRYSRKKCNLHFVFVAL